MDLSISTSDKVRSRIRDLPAYIRVCMVSTLLWGILAHGIALVTKFSMADEAHYLFSVGATVTSGRWFLGVLGAIVRWVFGSPVERTCNAFLYRAVQLRTGLVARAEPQMVLDSGQWPADRFSGNVRAVLL